jgi:hypothetical protein
MFEAAQSNLLTLAAGAVLSSCLLALASSESGQGEDAAVVSVLDGIASQIAGAQCSASHPSSTIPLEAASRAFPKRVVLVTLLGSHLRARTASGAALVSVEFPALPLDAPVELLGRAALVLSFDFLVERCAVSVE